MKVTRAIRMEFEPKDKPFDAYEAAMEAGSPSLAHVAMKACEAARETGLRKGFVEVSEKEASVRLPNPVPRRHGFSRCRSTTRGARSSAPTCRRGRARCARRLRRRRRAEAPWRSR